MALIPPHFFNCVIAIGIRGSNDHIKWIGTGSLVGRLFRKISENQNEYHIYIVTNRHVLSGHKAVVVRFNPMGSESAKDFDIPLFDSKGIPYWQGHSKVDLAAIGIDADFLRHEKISYSFFKLDSNGMNLLEMTQNGVSEGDFIYVLGFPMGIVDLDRQYVIARSGIIARLRDAIEKRGLEFLIDASVFPGNSGGPVIYKPEIISVEGTLSVAKPSLIGIVSGYLSFKDIAVSQQTGKTRVIFEENSGLAMVIPMDYVSETIELCFKARKVEESSTS
jgi:S1-C subfamily serine protease